MSWGTLTSGRDLRQQTNAAFKLATILGKKCNLQHKHPEKKKCELVFITMPPPVSMFVPPSFGPCNFTLPHFQGGTFKTNLQWVEKVSKNVSKMHVKILKLTRQPHMRDVIRYADLTSILPLQGKKVLDLYCWSAT